MQSITYALKEWAVAVEALQQGKTIMLLRKGGIKEQSGRFKVSQEQILLYPTYEHQQPLLLKPAYANQVIAVPSGWHPTTICIASWAKITDILPVSSELAIQDLLPFHIWNEQFISDRLKWKPQQPIQIILLRTYKLTQPQIISYRSEYGGCKSWINLAAPVVIEDAVPVLDDAHYNNLVTEIRGIISNNLSAINVP